MKQFKFQTDVATINIYVVTFFDILIKRKMFKGLILPREPVTYQYLGSDDNGIIVIRRGSLKESSKILTAITYFIQKSKKDVTEFELNSAVSIYLNILESYD